MVRAWSFLGKEISQIAFSLHCYLMKLAPAFVISSLALIKWGLWLSQFTLQGLSSTSEPQGGWRISNFPPTSSFYTRLLWWPDSPKGHFFFSFPWFNPTSISYEKASINAPVINIKPKWNEWEIFLCTG